MTQSRHDTATLRRHMSETALGGNHPTTVVVPRAELERLLSLRIEESVRFIDAVSPFVRDVLDEPFPWKTGGQVITVMDRAEYDEALSALEALRD